MKQLQLYNTASLLVVNTPSVKADPQYLIFFSTADGTDQSYALHAPLFSQAPTIGNRTENEISYELYKSPGTAHEWQTWKRRLNQFAQKIF